MSNQADIRDIQILGDLKSAFGRFGADVLELLASLQKQFEEIQERFESRQAYWQQQVDTAQEEVYAARRSLSECERQPDDDKGNSPDCSCEAEQVADAERLLAECEENLETVKQWRHRIARLIADFQNDMHRLSNLATSRTGSAQTFLANKIQILDRYISGMSSAGRSVALPGPSESDIMGTNVRETSTEIKSDWLQILQSLLREYQTAPDPELCELARKALEVPKSDRKTLAMTFSTNEADTNSIARQGAGIIERFVSPNLIKNTVIKLHSTQSSRSYYRNGEVHLSQKASKNVAAHEIMHGVEQQNPEVLKAATEFLFSRGRGEAPADLSHLTGQNYGPKEKAFEDSWRERMGSAYAGKIYSRYESPTKPNQLHATEVLTMGIERLVADPLEFFKNDLEWLAFTVNTLRSL